MKAEFLLLGGDARQSALARLLARHGEVRTLGVPGLADSPEPDAARVVLPIPSLTPEGSLRGVPPRLLPVLRAAERIYGGALRGRQPEGLAVTDLLEDAAVAAENARLTAEAALPLLLEHTRESLFGSRCAVLGFGRIGQLLCPRLAVFGARVTVCSAREEKRALAEALGYESVPPATLDACAPRFVFNTAPAPLVPAAALCRLPEDGLWVELASAPGGLPPGSPLPCPVLPAGGLPGKLLPVSAAAVLCRAILRTL